MSDAQRCGVMAACGRWAGHRGHHGGFRPEASEAASAGLVTGLYRLTPREAEIIILYASVDDMTGSEVAHRLGISVQTVKNHLTSAYRKLGVTNIIGAFRVIGLLRTGEGSADRLTEAALIGRIDTTLEVLAQVTGRLDEMRDWLVSARTVEEAS